MIRLITNLTLDSERISLIALLDDHLGLYQIQYIVSELMVEKYKL